MNYFWLAHWGLVGFMLAHLCVVFDYRINLSYVNWAMLLLFYTLMTVFWPCFALLWAAEVLHDKWSEV